MHAGHYVFCGGPTYASGTGGTKGTGVTGAREAARPRVAQLVRNTSNRSGISFACIPLRPKHNLPIRLCLMQNMYQVICSNLTNGKVRSYALRNQILFLILTKIVTQLRRQGSTYYYIVSTVRYIFITLAIEFSNIFMLVNPKSLNVYDVRVTIFWTKCQSLRLVTCERNLALMQSDYRFL